ncbi:EF-hand calcium-binding domain-containing protein 6-like, partial [Polypterus senegalus]|uniref:EF-hand calcium-binding domain-containing protein 6-like n=1 Tax=Polypterus senegalus TaxID=55291 RepID=UPI0019656A7A
LCGPCKNLTTGEIFYKQFLDSLGVSVQPGDLAGVSTQVSEGSQQREEERRADHSERMKQIDKEANCLTKKMTVQEIIFKLKEQMAQRDATIRESFLANCQQPNGRVTKKDLKKLLDNCGMIMDNEQFQTLSDALGFKNEGMTYHDFLAAFESFYLNRSNVGAPIGSNHHVNGTQVHYMTAEECLGQMMNKMNEKFGDLYSAFYKMDRNRDGILTMHDIRDLVDSFMFIMKEKEYQRLLKLLGLGPYSTLNYPEFLKLFQVRETSAAHPWLKSVH